MADRDTCTTRGAPRFADVALARLAREQGDSAAWAAAFAQHGQRAAEAVTGDFAVGQQDPNGRTWLAVDRFAVHSMCYRVVDGRLQFAERADALANPQAGGQTGARADLDPQAIFDYLYFHCIPSPRTIFKGVHRLPPAHCAQFDNGVLRVAPYWTAEFEEPRSATFEPLRDEFRDLLRSAVTRQLDSGRPACFLSGGTDSSTLAGMIGQVRGVPAATYSIGFEAAGYDEMEYARIAARHFGCEHHEYYVTPEDLVRTAVRQRAADDLLHLAVMEINAGAEHGY